MTAMFRSEKGKAMSLIDVRVMISGLHKLAQSRCGSERSALHYTAAQIRNVQERALSQRSFITGASAYMDRFERDPSESALSSTASELLHAGQCLTQFEVELRVRMECAEMLLHALGLELPEAESKAA